MSVCLFMTFIGATVSPTKFSSKFYFKFFLIIFFISWITITNTSFIFTSFTHQKQKLFHKYCLKINSQKLCPINFSLDLKTASSVCQWTSLVSLHIYQSIPKWHFKNRLISIYSFIKMVKKLLLKMK
jgi:hypothetical protein